MTDTASSEEVRDELLEAVRSAIREASDDEHFYGAWKRGGRMSGGAMAKAKASQRRRSRQRSAKKDEPTRPKPGEPGPNATPEQIARLDAAKEELAKAKAGVAKRPESKAAQARLKRAQDNATSAWWAASATKPHGYDAKSQLALAKQLKKPTLTEVKGRLPSGVTVEWKTKPRAVNAPTGKGSMMGMVVAHRKGYKSKQLPVQRDLDGKLTVGTPWNESSLYWYKGEGVEGE